MATATHICAAVEVCQRKKRQSHREVPPRSLFLPPHLPLFTLLSTLCGAVDNRLRAQPPPLTPLASQFIDRIMRRSREKGKNKSKRNCVKMRRVRAPSPYLPPSLPLPAPFLLRATDAFLLYLHFTRPRGSSSIRLRSGATGFLKLPSRQGGRDDPLPFFPLFLIAKVQFALQVSLHAQLQASCGFIVRWLPVESVGSNRLGLLLDQLKGRR